MKTSILVVIVLMGFVTLSFALMCDETTDSAGSACGTDDAGECQWMKGKKTCTEDDKGCRLKCIQKVGNGNNDCNNKEENTDCTYIDENDSEAEGICILTHPNPNLNKDCTSDDNGCQLKCFAVYLGV